jgi:hypothetical protein
MMRDDPLAALALQWRATADSLAAYGAGEAADAVRRCAEELEAVLRTSDETPLTLEQAVGESGLSYSALEKAVRAGRIPNVGRKGAPRVRRADLPKKGAQANGSPSVATLVLRRGG